MQGCGTNANSHVRHHADRGLQIHKERPSANVRCDTRKRTPEPKAELDSIDMQLQHIVEQGEHGCQREGDDKERYEAKLHHHLGIWRVAARKWGGW